MGEKNVENIDFSISMNEEVKLQSNIMNTLLLWCSIIVSIIKTNKIKPPAVLFNKKYQQLKKLYADEYNNTKHTW